ncbi:hypothetical protein FRB98_002357 [Tulasnella sp. 332]|nr:hypothetical protein FRB98_002357 [Tulasnella sp. 332]
MSISVTPRAVHLSDIKAAHERIKPYVHRTPVLTSATIDDIVSGRFDGNIKIRLLFKCENFQKAGAFKFRGATNAIRLLLSEQNASEPLNPGEGSSHRAKYNFPVITHSSGNHAQALALAAQQQGVTCHVIMPSNAPGVKKSAVRGYSAIVTECVPTLAAREETVLEVTRRLEAADSQVKVEFISPYDDVRVISGQGTAAVELLEQAMELTGRTLNALVVPVGGGGLLSGCAVAAKGTDESIFVIGAEPSGADDAFRSFYGKAFVPSIEPKTIADGLLTSLGTHTFPLILKHVDAIQTVTEDQIIRATKLVYERMKIVIEPSSAVSLAVALYSPGEFWRYLSAVTPRTFNASISPTGLDFVGKIEQLAKGKESPIEVNVGIVFSGGNVDLVNLVERFKGIDGL